MSERKYMLRSTEECFVKHAKQKTINDDLGGPTVSRAEYLKHYNNSESKLGRKILRLSRIKEIYSLSRI